jgi:hypothetical protein
MAVFMAIQMGATVIAEDEVIIEIVVEAVDCCQKEKLIINALNGDDSGFQAIAPMSIFCLFGHSMAQTTSITTEHRYWAAAPRCRRTTHRVDYCTRSSCNYVVMTQLSQNRITCCS